MGENKAVIGYRIVNKIMCSFVGGSASQESEKQDFQTCGNPDVHKQCIGLT